MTHADHSRVIDPAHRAAIYTPNGMLPGTLLVDGFVAATWAIERTPTSALLRIASFERIGPAERAEVSAEGQRLLAFAVPESTRRDVLFTRRK